MLLMAWMGVLFAQSNLNKGLTAFNQRAEGSIEDKARPEPINKAIKFYQLALREPEDEIEAVIGLLKSYYYKGKYVAESDDQKKYIFDQAKQLASIYMKQYSDRADLRYWYLSNLGSWAEVYGILTAAREGVADQMREHAEKIIELEPEYQNGGGYLLLGAVHYKSPYIPFILSWPDNKEAVKFLEKSTIIGYATPVQKVYLAQALYKERERKRAIKLLNEVANMSPSTNNSLSDWEQIKKARELLKKYN